MLKEKDLILLVKWHDWKVNEHLELENYVSSLLRKKIEIIFDKSLASTQQELIKMGVYDKTRIGKSLQRLEQFGLIEIRTWKQFVLDGGGKEAWKKNIKHIKDVKKYYEKYKNSPPHQMSKNEFEKSYNWIQNKRYDPRERIITLTYKGRFLTEILKEGGEGSNLCFSPAPSHTP